MTALAAGLGVIAELTGRMQRVRKLDHVPLSEDARHCYSAAQEMFVGGQQAADMRARILANQNGASA